MNDFLDSTSKLLQNSAKEQSIFLSNCQPPSYEESHFKQLADDIKTPLEEQVESIRSIAKSADELAKDSKDIANSAKQSSDLAVTKSKKADIKGWISIFIAAFGVFIEFAIHHAQVISFVKSLLEV